MPMLKTFLSLLVAFCVLVAAGVAEALGDDNAPAVPKKQSYASQFFGFSFDNTEFPSTEPCEHVQVVVARGSEAEDGFLPNVNVVIQFKRTNAKDYIVLSRAELERMDLKVIEATEIKHNGVEAAWFEATGEMDGVRLYFISLAVITEDRVYLTTGTLPSAAKDKWYERAKAAVQSFKLAK